jgi:hypothetical protein
MKQTLATFGPDQFDEVMASNILWGHIGSVQSAILAGLTGYILYPNIKYCFLVIGLSATLAVGGVRFLPEGDPLQGRGLESPRNSTVAQSTVESTPDYLRMEVQRTASVVSSYEDVFLDRKTIVVCLTGFFFQWVLFLFLFFDIRIMTYIFWSLSFANANVLLVLGELMGGDNEDGSVKRTAIPLIAGAIVLAQCTMTIATYIGDEMTKRNCGRKPLFLAGLITLPIRCALIILWRDRGEAWLLSTQILDGIGGGFFGLLHPYLVADITFGTGRFNVLSKFLIALVLKSSIHLLNSHFWWISGTYGIVFWLGRYIKQLTWTDGCREVGPRS